MSVLHRRALLLTALVLFAPLLLAGRADAGVLVSSATDCERQTLEQPFLPWLDPAHYVLAPDGTFSSAASGWTLAGPSVVGENEPFYVHGDDRPRSLSLELGSSATSPAMCVGLLHPTLRFFARKPARRSVRCTSRSSTRTPRAMSTRCRSAR